ncbi:class I SAM-dependent RNA methyltransferase, partial [bacterium]|nr:class I SAM-dependent RNA methyltransferase [bacterium]
MNTGEIYDVQIEKLSSTGAGIARIDGFVVFVSNVCPQDKVKIKITKVNKNFANGEIVEITEPSKYRVNQFCPMQKICGACQIQFIDYDYQLEIKREIVKDALQKIGNIVIEIPKVIPSPDIKNYRHKIQYPISQTKNSKRILAGYYKPSTHEIVNIKYCPIQPEICDKIINFIRDNAQELNISGYNEKNHTGILRHVVIRHSVKNQNCLVTFVLNGDLTTNINTLAQKLYDSFEQVIGVCVNVNT